MYVSYLLPSSTPPPHLFKSIYSAWWRLKGGSCAKVVDPKSLSKNERGEALIARSTGVNMRSQPQIKRTEKKKKDPIKAVMASTSQSDKCFLLEKSYHL